MPAAGSAVSATWSPYMQIRDVFYPHDPAQGRRWCMGLVGLHPNDMVPSTVDGRYTVSLTASQPFVPQSFVRPSEPPLALIFPCRRCRASRLGSWTRAISGLWKEARFPFLH